MHNRRILKSSEEEIVLPQVTHGWEEIERIWDKLPIKIFTVHMTCGQHVNKKFHYQNKTPYDINYTMLTNMPNLVEVKTKDVHIRKGETVYLKLMFKLPQSSCKINPKVALLSKKDGLAREGLLFEITIQSN